MAKYIDADKLIETLREIQGTHSPNLTKATNEAIDLGLSLAMRMARKEPTADVAEVKHGEWIYKTTYGQLEECNCSLCGQLMSTVEGKRMNYCPKCGADMRGDTDGKL